LLDIAAEVLVADPAASLAEVARAAGIGRTTLHKHYATRDDLLYAVAHRALDLWAEAVSSIPDGPDGGLRALTEAMIPIGPQLEFLWRTPAFDHVVEINDRWRVVEAAGLAVLRRAQAHGVLVAASDYWLLQTFYSLIYVAAESIQNGKIARADAPDLVLNTYLNGLGKDRA
jgi:AcrR family transcriptional regulator